MDNLLAWIVIGATSIGAVALIAFRRSGRSNGAERIGETSADDDGAMVAATSAVTSAAIAASVDTCSASSSSSSSIV
jgi:hypothetical protein